LSSTAESRLFTSRPMLAMKVRGLRGGGPVRVRSRLEKSDDFDETET
jgi:hypothetical protein